MAKIKHTIAVGLTYPVILLLAAFGFMWMFGSEVVPAFEEVLPREHWTGAAANMALISDFVRHWMVPVVVGLIGAIATIVWSLPRWTGPIRAQFDKYPPWSMYRLVNGAGFMLSVSALFGAGVQLPEILRILRRGASPWYFERIDGALLHVSNGANLGDALYKTGLGFPDLETVRDLRSFAELSGFEETLQEMGRQWVEESVQKVSNQTAMMRNFCLLFFGVVFSLIATGIFSVQQLISATVGG